MNWDGVWSQLPENDDIQTKEILKKEMEFVVNSITQMTGAAAPLTLKGGVDNYNELMQQQDLILLKNLYPDIMSQVDISQLPMTINNYNP